MVPDPPNPRRPRRTQVRINALPDHRSCHTMYGMSKTRKINARITPEAERKLLEIVRATGSSMSDIIIKSIDLYYRQGAIPSNETPYEVAKRSGVIGVLKGGPSDLSARYKEYLASGLVEKHGAGRRTAPSDD